MEVLEYMRNSVDQQHGRFTQFCGDLFRRFINVEESWEEVRCADSALRKEAYGGVSFCDTAILQRGCFVWGPIPRFRSVQW